MPKYAVNVTAEYSVTYTVEAENKEQANDIAFDLFCDEHDNGWDNLTCTSEGVKDDCKDETNT